MNRSLNIFKTTISGLVLAACTLFYSNAYAQWCTGDDYTCWGTAQARQEIEDAANRGRNNGGGSAPVYVPTKPSKYGAVAIDSANGIWGYSVLQPSKKAANLAAIADCGNSRCKIKANYANTCFAIAWGTDNKKGIFGIRGDILKSAAEQKALSACNEDIQNCKIIMSECTLP
jgi:hypothetical protein